MDDVQMPPPREYRILNPVWRLVKDALEGDDSPLAERWRDGEPRCAGLPGSRTTYTKVRLSREEALDAADLLRSLSPDDAGVYVSIAELTG